MPALDRHVKPSNEPDEAVKTATSLPHRLAFWLSAILSPYIVIPVGTLGILYVRSDPSQFFLWAGISIFFSTVLPALYVVAGIFRGTITDVHVMERGQRGGPFAVAVVGGFLAAYFLRILHAPPSVWGLSLILGVNGLFIWAITSFTKISVHVSVLSATVLGAIILHPELNPWTLLWMLPALIWARQARGRHSVWQGIGGCLLASVVTTATIIYLKLGDRILQAFQNAT